MPVRHQLVVDELQEPPPRRFQVSNAFGHSLKSIERSRSSRCRKTAYACRELLYRSPGPTAIVAGYAMGTGRCAGVNAGGTR